MVARGELNVAALGVGVAHGVLIRRGDVLADGGVRLRAGADELGGGFN